MTLFSALRKGLRWLTAAAILSVALELALSSSGDKFSFLPLAEKHTVCQDCNNALRRLDVSINDLVAADVDAFIAKSKSNSIPDVFTATRSKYRIAVRKELARQAIKNACRGVARHEECSAPLQRHKTAAVKAIAHSESIFRLAIQSAMARRFGEPGKDLTALFGSPNPTFKSLSAVVCSTECNKRVLFWEMVVPQWVLADPAVRQALVFLAQGWGTVLIVTIIGTLLVMTLHVRSSAAQRQHQLYEKLLAQFQGRMATTHKMSDAPTRHS